MQALRRFILIGLLLTVVSCGETPEEPRLDLEEISFSDLDGWRDDNQGQALAAFLRSCAKLAAAWRDACAAANALDGDDDDATRDFFETHFTPLRMSDRGETDGLFTGYYEPLLNGAKQPGGRFTVPIHGLPLEHVTADLGLFYDDLSGRKITGRVVDGVLSPYPGRAEITGGALGVAASVLAWVDDPVDAFFLHVQGSGRISLADGGVMRIGYAGVNGQAYASIGRALVKRGAIKLEEASLQTIRAWLAANPDQAAEVLALNPSYVFFRELMGDGPLGAQGVALTAGRSLAVDRAFIPLGAPIWLDIMAPSAAPGGPDRELRRLVVAQDVGGAIKGPLRGDLFWGFGPDAEWAAGHMKHKGGYVLLLPKALAKTML